MHNSKILDLGTLIQVTDEHGAGSALCVIHDLGWAVIAAGVRADAAWLAHLFSKANLKWFALCKKQVRSWDLQRFRARMMASLQHCGKVFRNPRSIQDLRSCMMFQVTAELA